MSAVLYWRSCEDYHVNKSRINANEMLSLLTASMHIAGTAQHAVQDMPANVYFVKHMCVNKACCFVGLLACVPWQPYNVFFRGSVPLIVFACSTAERSPISLNVPSVQGSYTQNRGYLSVCIFILRNESFVEIVRCLLIKRACGYAVYMCVCVFVLIRAFHNELRGSYNILSLPYFMHIWYQEEYVYSRPRGRTSTSMQSTVNNGQVSSVWSKWGSGCSIIWARFWWI